MEWIPTAIATVLLLGVGAKYAGPVVLGWLKSSQPSPPSDDYNPKRPDSPSQAVFRFCQLRCTLEKAGNFAAIEAIQPAWPLLLPPVKTPESKE